MTDTEALLAAAIHESHDEALDDSCWHWAGTLGEEPYVPGKDCENMARRFLATPSGQRLLAPSERERRESEVGRKAYLALAGHHGRHQASNDYPKCDVCRTYLRLRAALAQPPDTIEGCPHEHVGTCLEPVGDAVDVVACGCPSMVITPWHQPDAQEAATDYQIALRRMRGDRS